MTGNPSECNVAATAALTLATVLLECNGLSKADALAQVGEVLAYWNRWFRNVEGFREELSKRKQEGR